MEITRYTNIRRDIRRLLESRSGQKLKRGEVFQLSCGTSVVLLIHANIPLFVRDGSSSTSKSWKPPYDPEGVGATENQNK